MRHGWRSEQSDSSPMPLTALPTSDHTDTRLGEVGGSLIGARIIAAARAATAIHMAQVASAWASQNRSSWWGRRGRWGWVGEGQETDAGEARNAAGRGL